MSFSEMLKIEFMKVKRSKIVPLLMLAPLPAVVSGVSSLSMYFTPEYTNAWPAMFIQSALLYAYYLLPFSMIVVCVMLAGRETQNNGILKMPALPNQYNPAFTGKILHTIVLSADGDGCLSRCIHPCRIYSRIHQRNHRDDAPPLLYLLKWCAGLFLTMLPCTATMWAKTVLSDKPLIAVDLNLLFVIPGLLAAAAPVWFLYPYCYRGYLFYCSLHEFTAGGTATAL